MPAINVAVRDAVLLVALVVGVVRIVSLTRAMNGKAVRILSVTRLDWHDQHGQYRGENIMLTLRRADYRAVSSR